MTSNRGRSIVFYPRAYNTRGESKKHSMIGVTSNNELINVKLRLDSKHEDKENAPSIKEFAKTDYFAKTPCIASDDNSPENSEGILLLSRCTKDGFDNDKNVDVYTARWAVIISPSSKSKEPVFGLGRMEIKKDSPTVKKLTGLMKKSEYDNRAKDADAFKEQIEDPKNWSYPAIFYYPELMISIPSDSYNDLKEKGDAILDSLTKSGIAGGFAIRARTKLNEVIKSSYKEIFVKFIISESRYQHGNEAIETIVDYLDENLPENGHRWDLIPIKKINTGPASSRHYGSEKKLEFTRLMFTFDKDEEPRLSRCCARVSYFGDTDNTLLSRLYTLSEPLDHPARLDKSGHFSLTFEGEGTKLAHLPQETDVVKEIPDGISKDETLLNKALWLLTGDIPILRTEGNEDPEDSLTNDSDDSTNECTKEEKDSPESEDESSSLESDGNLIKTDIESVNPQGVGSTLNTNSVDLGSDDINDSDVLEEDSCDDKDKDDDLFVMGDMEESTLEIQSKKYKDGKIDSAEENESDEKAFESVSLKESDNSKSSQESKNQDKTESNENEEKKSASEKPKLKGMAASILKKKRG